MSWESSVVAVAEAATGEKIPKVEVSHALPKGRRFPMLYDLAGDIIPMILMAVGMTGMLYSAYLMLHW